MCGRTSVAVRREAEESEAPGGRTGWTEITSRRSTTARTSLWLHQMSPWLTPARAPPTSSPVLPRARAAGKKWENVSGRNIELPARTSRQLPASQERSRNVRTDVRTGGSAINVQQQQPPNRSLSRPRSQWDPPNPPDPPDPPDLLLRVQASPAPRPLHHRALSLDPLEYPLSKTWIYLSLMLDDWRSRPDEGGKDWGVLEWYLVWYWLQGEISCPSVVSWLSHRYRNIHSGFCSSCYHIYLIVQFCAMFGLIGILL